MIVRIATEDQYELPEDAVGRLNELDNEAVAAVERGDEARFHDVYERLLQHVRDHGTPVGADELEGSDLILPPPDLTFAEAGENFTGEGLIPDT